MAKRVIRMTSRVDYELKNLVTQEAKDLAIALASSGVSCMEAQQKVFALSVKQGYTKEIAHYAAVVAALEFRREEGRIGREKFRMAAIVFERTDGRECFRVKEK